MVWKVCAAVVNCRLKRSVTIHDVLYGFKTGRGMGTLTLEEKLVQQLVGIVHKPLLQMFLDVHKAYDYLDRGRCMEILRGYRMGQNMARLIDHHWDNQLFVPKVSRFIGRALVTGRGVTQGNHTSPMIFNILVDAVVRAVLAVVCGPQEAQHGMGWAVGERNLVFYKDDRLIAVRD